MIKITNEEMKVIFNDAMKYGEYGRINYLMNAITAKAKYIELDGLWDLDQDRLRRVLKDKDADNENILIKYFDCMFDDFYCVVYDEMKKTKMLEMYEKYKKNKVYTIDTINKFIVELDKIY